MALQSGDLMGSYRIISQYGQGGMATVYKAYHPQLERNVAIKFLQQPFTDDLNFLARFERETKTIANLDHPPITPIYDFDYFDGRPSPVMELIERQRHKEILADSTLQELQRLDMLVAVAHSLTSAGCDPLNSINISIFSGTFRVEKNSTIHPNIRAQVGQALCNMAQTPDEISLRELYRLNGSIPDFQPPNLFDIMTVQILVVQKRLPLVQAAFIRLPDETSIFPEVYLVRGELFQVQGSLEKARKEWNAVLQIPDTPQWVTDRVTNLLNSN